MNQSLVYNLRLIDRVSDILLIKQEYFLLIHFRLPIVFTNVIDTNSYRLILSVVNSSVI